MAPRVVTSSWRRVRDAPITAVIGAVAGVWIGLYLADDAPAWYDSVRPVASAEVSFVRRDPPGAIVLMVGIKHRECELLSFQAYTMDDGGRMQRRTIERADGLPAITRPVGEWGPGEWRVWPVSDTRARVRIYAQHQCGSRLVTGRLGEVEIP